MKEKESCKTCKFRTGSKCSKNNENINDEENEWCSAFKRENRQPT